MAKRFRNLIARKPSAWHAGIQARKRQFFAEMRLPDCAGRVRFSREQLQRAFGLRERKKRARRRKGSLITECKTPSTGTAVPDAQTLFLALSCAEQPENRDAFASARVARVRSSRVRPRSERLGESDSYAKVREKRRGSAVGRPSTLNQRVQGSSP